MMSSLVANLAPAEDRPRERVRAALVPALSASELGAEDGLVANKDPACCDSPNPDRSMAGAEPAAVSDAPCSTHAAVNGRPSAARASGASVGVWWRCRFRPFA